MPLVNLQDKFIIRTGGGEITAPSTPSISNKSASGFTVSWNAVAGAIGYRLDVSASSDFSSFVSGYNSKAVSGTSEVVTGLSPDTTYYVRVRTVSASSNSGSVSETTEVSTFPSNGLLAFYKLDDLTDASGNGNTLTNNGDVTFSSGKIGNAASFGGSNNLKSSLVVPYSTSDVTLSLWLKIAATSQWRTFFGSSFNSGQRINVGTTNADQIFINNASNDGPISTLSNYTVDDTWQHIVFVITNDGDSVNIYRAGNLVDEFTGVALGSTEVWIGGGAGYPVEADPFDGQIDAVGIWNRALTEQEITQLYNSGNGLEL